MVRDAAVSEVAKIALEHDTGARGLRSVIEEVVEGLLSEVAAGVRYVISKVTALGGEAIKRRMSQQADPKRPTLAASSGQELVMTFTMQRASNLRLTWGYWLDFACVLCIVKYPKPGACSLTGRR
jgi:hypothetical protein